MKIKVQIGKKLIMINDKKCKGRKLRKRQRTKGRKIKERRGCKRKKSERKKN